MSSTATAVKLSVTDSAVAEVKKFIVAEGIADTAGLRVRVVPGGCSGFSYSLNIEEESQTGDNVIESNGLKVFVDPLSVQYLNGIEVDYVNSVMGSGFTFNNPNSTGSCGCGSSFSV
jgi:iron-sulfur cluster assembly accessory protein